MQRATCRRRRSRRRTSTASASRPQRRGRDVKIAPRATIEPRQAGRTRTQLHPHAAARSLPRQIPPHRALMAGLTTPVPVVRRNSHDRDDRHPAPLPPPSPSSRLAAWLSDAVICSVPLLSWPASSGRDHVAEAHACEPDPCRRDVHDADPTASERPHLGHRRRRRRPRHLPPAPRRPKHRASAQASRLSSLLVPNTNHARHHLISHAPFGNLQLHLLFLPTKPATA